MTEPAMAEDRTPLRWWEIVLGVLAPLGGIIGVLLVASLLSGCVYKGAKVTEGTDLAIGLNIPVSEGTLQLQLLNYLSGFRLGVAENSLLTVDYTVSETNDYLGCVTTRVTKRAVVRVEPLDIPSLSPESQEATGESDEEPSDEGR